MTLLSWFRGTVPPRCYPIAKRRQTLGGENSDTARSTKVSTIQRVREKSGKRAENFMYSRNSIRRGGFFKENFSNIIPRLNGSSSVRE